MMYTDVIRDFAARTKSNLEAIEASQRNGDDVFEVTQLINSMLGLLIFPQQQYIDKIPRTPLTELESSGWPVPKMRGTFPQVNDLNKLIKYLRNAIAHFNVKFIGDGNNEIAVLRVWNMTPVRKNGRIVRDKNGRPLEEKNWEAELSFQDLRKITVKFIELIETNEIHT